MLWSSFHGSNVKVKGLMLSCPLTKVRRTYLRGEKQCPVVKSDASVINFYKMICGVRCSWSVRIRRKTSFTEATQVMICLANLANHLHTKIWWMALIGYVAPRRGVEISVDHFCALTFSSGGYRFLGKNCHRFNLLRLYPVLYFLLWFAVFSPVLFPVHRFVQNFFIISWLSDRVTNVFHFSCYFKANI